MSALLIVAATVAYLAGSLAAARRLYGRWRARAIDKEVAGDYRTWDSAETKVARAVDWFTQVDRPFCMVGALGAGLAWPAVLPLWAIGAAAVRWLDGTPVRARGELAAGQAQLAARIAELESQLGINPHV